MLVVDILLVAAAAWIAVIFIRAAAFKPQKTQKAVPDEAVVDGQRAIESLQAMVRCKTVSSKDDTLRDENEFEKFRALLKVRYPLVHKNLSLERHGETGLLYFWKGKSSAAPSVLMAHYDVVPAVARQWKRPPFDGVIEDGYLWGRGTLDTKGTLCGVMESAETLLAAGFVPENDLYFSFAGDEEVTGAGAVAIVDALEKRGVVPALVVDEGGAVVENVFPGVKEPCALVGIAEKGMMDVEFFVKSSGGHASAPPPHGTVGKLANTVLRVENNPFPARINAPVAKMFDTLGRRSTFFYRVIFANLWCFAPLLDLLCKKTGGELNALLRTTCAFTMMKGSDASNVLPPTASVVANLRLIGGDTPDRALDYLKKTVADGDVQLVKWHGTPSSRVSDTDCAGYEKLKAAIEKTWPTAVVSPYLMIQCSDSRHFCRISDKVFRFSAMALTKEERATIHGNNERIPLEKIVTTVQFYLRLMRTL